MSDTPALLYFLHTLHAYASFVPELFTATWEGSIKKSTCSPNSSIDRSVCFAIVNCRQVVKGDPSMSFTQRLIHVELSAGALDS